MATAYEAAVMLIEQLSPIDQARLIARLASSIEQLLTQPQEPTLAARPLLRGFLADVGPAPSDTDVIDVQREMWATFPSTTI